MYPYGTKLLHFLLIALFRAQALHSSRLMEGVISRLTNKETTKQKMPLLSQETLVIPLHFSRGRLVQKTKTLPQFRAQQNACDIHTYFSPKRAMTVQQLACECATGTTSGKAVQQPCWRSWKLNLPVESGRKESRGRPSS